MAGDDILLRVLAETSQAKREVEGLRVAFEAALARMEAAARRPDFDPLSAEARLLRREVEITGAKFIEVFNRADKEVRETARELDAARRGVRQLDVELERLGKSGAGSVSGLVASLGELRAAFLSIGGISYARRIGETIGRALGEAAGEVQTTRIELEALRAQLDAAAGSSEAGGRAFDFARDQALRLGQDLEGTVQSLARFEAATKNTNLTLAQRRELFESVAEAGRVMQLSTQRVNLAFLALEQIASKGVASMEELRRQLGDQIPGVLPGLAKQLNISQAELFKLIETGKLASDEVLPALTRFFKEISESGLAAALETDAAALGKLRTQFQLLKAEVAAGFAEETSAGIDAVATAAESAGPAARAAGEGFAYLLKQILAIPLRDVADDLGFVVKVLELLGLRQAAVAGGTQALNLANDDLEGSLAGMVPVVKAAEDVFRGYSQEVLTTAEAIEKAKQGDEAAAAQLAETIRLAKEKVPALKAMAEAARGAAEEEEKRKTVEEQMAEALARSAKEQEEFNQRLFESRGNLFKSREELDKLRVQIINAVDSLVLLGAASVEQTDKALDFALKVAAGYREMGEAVPVELIERIDMLAAASVDGAEKVAKALREEIDAFVALGEAVPPELLARFDRLTKIIEGQERALALSALGMREFREELFGVGADIDTRTEQLTKLVASLGLLGPATVEQGVIIRKEIQEQLDAYAELGVDPPIHLQEIADRFDVVTSRIEAQRKALKALTDDFAALADKIKASRAETGAAQDLAAQREELEALQAKQREGGILTLEEVERIGQLETSISRLAGEVEGLGTDFDRFGDQATASIEDVDDAIRDLIRSNQEALAGLDPATQEAIFNILGGLQDAAAQGTATEERIRDAMLKIGDQLQIAGVDTKDFAQAMEDASGEGLNLNRELAKLAEGTGDAGDAMKEYQDRVDKANEAQKEASEEAKALGKEIKAAVDESVDEVGRLQTAFEPIVQQLTTIVDLCRQWHACMRGQGAA